MLGTPVGRARRVADFDVGNDRAAPRAVEFSISIELEHRRGGR
jgi:hypothetical protein